MIDWARVDELRDDLGADGFQEITAIFLEEVEEKLSGLEGAGGAVLSDGLHFLKGSAANLGFSELQRICQTAEAAPDTCDMTRISEVYHASKEEFLAAG